uniref:Uncharacterized protein n=2 Tax=Eutreptiella gymnastica TaxID=73025 RepID=A0A7S1HTB8_9EUGL|mmetsp:Transcript_104488/g.180046  ORF Transcript_104488/g.180046 Transcript_104488/m.180046 type:complete len:334 (+) Transcript_104488:67-1068(+)
MASISVNGPQPKRKAKKDAHSFLLPFGNVAAHDASRKSNKLNKLAQETLVERLYPLTEENIRKKEERQKELDERYYAEFEAAQRKYKEFPEETVEDVLGRVCPTKEEAFVHNNDFGLFGGPAITVGQYSNTRDPHLWHYWHRNKHVRKRMKETMRRLETLAQSTHREPPAYERPPGMPKPGSKPKAKKTRSTDGERKAKQKEDALADKKQADHSAATVDDQHNSDSEGAVATDMEEEETEGEEADIKVEMEDDADESDQRSEKDSDTSGASYESGAESNNQKQKKTGADTGTDTDTGDESASDDKSSSSSSRNSSSSSSGSSGSDDESESDSD